MDEKNYYEKFFGYLNVDGFYREQAHLWQGKELFNELKSLFKNKIVSEAPELTSFHSFYKKMYDPFKNDSGYLVPIHLLKKENEPTYILLQKDTFIFIDDAVTGIQLSIATPGRGSGYIECSLYMKDGKMTQLPLFSDALYAIKSDEKHMYATQQVKKLADFLHVPLKLEMFVDA